MIKCEECGAEYYDKQTNCLICGTPLLLDGSNELDYPQENVQATKIIINTNVHYNFFAILTRKEYQIDVYQNSKYNGQAFWKLFISLILCSGLTMANINLFFKKTNPTAIEVGSPFYNFVSGYLIGTILLFILLTITFFAFLAVLMIINSLVFPYSSFWGLFRLFSYLYFLVMLSITALELILLIFTGSLIGSFNFMISDIGRVFVNFILSSLFIMVLGPIPYKNVYEKSYIISLVIFILSTMVTGTIFMGFFQFIY